MTLPFSGASISQRASNVCSSKGQALQLTSGLDFLSIQAYRLGMEHPSRGKVMKGEISSVKTALSCSGSHEIPMDFVSASAT